MGGQPLNLIFGDPMAAEAHHSLRPSRWVGHHDEHRGSDPVVCMALSWPHVVRTVAVRQRGPNARRDHGHHRRGGHHQSGPDDGLPVGAEVYTSGRPGRSRVSSYRPSVSLVVPMQRGTDRRANPGHLSRWTTSRYRSSQWTTGPPTTRREHRLLMIAAASWRPSPRRTAARPRRSTPRSARGRPVSWSCAWTATRFGTDAVEKSVA